MSDGFGLTGAGGQGWGFPSLRDVAPSPPTPRLPSSATSTTLDGIKTGGSLTGAAVVVFAAAAAASSYLGWKVWRLASKPKTQPQQQQQAADAVLGYPRGSAAPGSPRRSMEELMKASAPEDPLVAAYHAPSYLILRRFLGSGAFGQVFLAIDKRDLTLVAVKAMPAEKSEELKKEFLVVAGRRHPNVAEVKSFEVHREHAWLVMEYCAGGSMDQARKKQPPPSEAQLRKDATQLLRGLAFMHHLGVIHRDIKPANVLVSQPSGELKLTDFGLSRLSTSASLAVHTALAGTPLYLAPEVIADVEAGNRTVFRQASDIWALGVTLTTLASGGKKPWSHIPGFDSLDIPRICIAIRDRGRAGEHPLIPSSLSPGAKDFLETLMAGDPKRRTSCEELLKHPWLAEEGPMAAAASVAPPAAEGGSPQAPPQGDTVAPPSSA